MYSTNQTDKRRRPVLPAPDAPRLKSVRLLDQVRERIRYKHDSIRTERQYVYWVRYFIRFNALYARWSAQAPPRGVSSPGWRRPCARPAGCNLEGRCAAPRVRLRQLRRAGVHPDAVGPSRAGTSPTAFSKRAAQAAR